jgi:hypothetical protein
LGGYPVAFLTSATTIPATRNVAPSAAEPARLAGLSSRTATRLALGILLLGVAWRTVRYLLQFPFWGDEAMLAMNFAWFDFTQLTQRLENCQIAPLLFLWGERAAYALLGPGELSLRLLPFLAGIGSLLVYWRLTGLLLEPQARLFAVGFLAVANFPVAMTTLLKPYSLDLFVALVLLLLVVEWLQNSGQTSWLIRLTCFVPVSLLTSYPALFVAGGVSLALLPQAWRQGWPARCWFVAYQAALLGGFGLSYFIGLHQLGTVSGRASTQSGMASGWAYAFPPASPWQWPGWFVLLTTGQMAAYPLGASDGGSSLTVLCCLAGVACWVRQRRWALLASLSAPLVLNLAAATLGRYPYGGAARISQHLAPGLCILAGLGLSALVNRVSQLPQRRARWALGITCLFACIGLGGLVRDIAAPYYSPGSAWNRDAMKQMRVEVPATDPVVMCGDAHTLECVFVWYWLNEGQRVTWNYEVPPVARSGNQVWGFHQGPGADGACRRLDEALRRQDAGWQLVRRIPYVYEPRKRKESPQYCELFCFARSP